MGVWDREWSQNRLQLLFSYTQSDNNMEFPVIPSQGARSKSTASSGLIVPMYVCPTVGPEYGRKAINARDIY